MSNAKSTEVLIQDLFDRIFSTKTLKEISNNLEELTLDKRFKLHANAIVDDETLTDNQKKRQISYLLQTIDSPVLYDFLSDKVVNGNLWLFSSGKIDYFDKFVQQFQLATEGIGVVYLVTAIDLTPEELKKISKDLTKSFGYRVIVKHEINPEIIGGAQVRIENLIFDYSLRTKFTQFRKTWLNSLAKTNAIVGRN